ncbi:hypothetical protein A0H81_01870 [Grifola frondosa]|uniref:Uncharacterized protein n=1 Tax=Grifola frondosa TaxID=5627 RepID=A0A1C7MKB2_GRIFR|nr:hypothetical protein A0H81_01870 [Grifola frondosa]
MMYTVHSKYRPNSDIAKYPVREGGHRDTYLHDQCLRCNSAERFYGAFRHIESLRSRFNPAQGSSSDLLKYLVRGGDHRDTGCLTTRVFAMQLRKTL